MSTDKKLRTYPEVVSFLYEQLPMFQRVGPKAFKKDLTNIIDLCEGLGNPQDNFRSVHIAGTNGKGSVTHILAAMCSSQFEKVGIYTSPHLRDYRERIKINDEYITEEGVITFVRENLDLIRQVKPSFFEITVAMAFWWFDHMDVGIAVIETGLGGRLDSTNVITPLLSVITNIGNDHKNFLGDTPAEIAGEKAGIIKHGVPVIIGQRHPETAPVFLRKAEELEARLRFAEEIVEVTVMPSKKVDASLYRIRTEGLDAVQESDLNGAFQGENIRCAVAAYLELCTTYPFFHCKMDQDINKLRHLCSDLKFLGRWQILGKKPLVIADGGHNPEGLEQVLSQIEQIDHKNLYLVLGFVSEKDPLEMLSIWPKGARFHLTQAKIPRAMKLDVLKEASESLNLEAEFHPDASSALLKARELATPDDLIFVGGSLYIIAEIV